MLRVQSYCIPCLTPLSSSTVQHNFPTEFGDLHVKFDIIFPKSMPDGAKKCVEAW